MRRRLAIALLLVGFAGVLVAQVETVPHADKAPGANQPPPRSDRDQEAESSSRDTRIDISPPKDDLKKHPYGKAAVADAENPDDNTGVSEFHPWDPHKAAKDVEVGDFYFKRKNYPAALERYREALIYKDNDAMANFRMAQCLEKLDKPEEAVEHYQAYLKILPQGQFSVEAKKSVERLKDVSSQ